MIKKIEKLTREGRVIIDSWINIWKDWERYEFEIREKYKYYVLSIIKKYQRENMLGWK